MTPNMACPPPSSPATAKGLTLAKQIKSAFATSTAPVHDEAQMPFGGVGASGYGRFGGRQGIDSFTETRWITVETLPGHFRSDGGGSRRALRSPLRCTGQAPPP
jgi:hypothetical protein